MMKFILILIVLVSVKSQASICDNRETDLSLVLSLDVSGSIDDLEVQTQIEGYKNALSHPAVINNLLNCRCTAIGVVLWASTAKLSYKITRMESMDEINHLVAYFDKLMKRNRLAEGLGLSYQTHLIKGLELSRQQLLQQKEKSQDLMIMISGDGYDSRMMATLDDIRNLKSKNEQDGIVVNGLPLDIHRSGADFENTPDPMSKEQSQVHSTGPYETVSDYYKKEVVTSTGYVEISESYAELEKALTMTLIHNTCNLMM